MKKKVNTMTMKKPILLALAAVMASAAHAHRSWLLPSAMTVSGKDPVVTVDAAATEDLFDFAGHALKLDDVSVTAPDGSRVAVENPIQGKHRSSFDFKPAQKGTYRVANVSEATIASYKVGGETKRWRGAAENFAKEVPANAEDLQVTRMHSRVETFVSFEEPGGDAVRPQGKGLELQPLAAPTDLLTGGTSRFRLLLDGQPASDVMVTVVRGGNRYRYKLGEITLKTGADGEFAVTWPEAGLYWLSATVAPQRGGPAPAGTPDRPARRVSYSATLEVLPP